MTPTTKQAWRIGALALSIAIGVPLQTGPGRAEDGYIVPRGDGATCPSGYHASGSGCVAFHRDTPYAIPRDPKHACPSGTHASGDFCEAFR